MKRRRTRIGLFLGLAITLVSAQSMPGHAQNAKFEHPMGADAAVYTWTYDPHGEMKIAAMITEVEGKIAVCGMWTISKRLSPYIKETGLDRKTRGSANVVVKGKVVMNSLRTFRSVSKENFREGTKALCRVTPHAWNASYSNEDITIRTPKMTAF